MIDEGGTGFYFSGTIGLKKVGRGSVRTLGKNLGKIFMRKILCVNVGKYVYSPDRAGGWFGGLLFSGEQGRWKSKLGGVASGGIFTDGSSWIVPLGIGRGPVSAGIYVDLKRIPGMVKDDWAVMKDIWHSWYIHFAR